MKVPLDWLREFVRVPADAPAVSAKLAACGFEVASIEGDVIDFEITANRPDCLSVYGLAREAAAAFDLDLAAAPGGVDRSGPASIPVSIGDAGCGRYALGLATVKVGPSPAWLADRLTAAGVRPINNIVDVTNYVMIETGHPMHAFDVARLSGPEIRVRRARAGEKLTTLDGIERTLDDTMLVIADRERAVAIAGVMGGLSSEVAGTTSHVALESAWFVPASVRATSRKLGLKTEASARFERGADITSAVRALGRAIELLERIGAGSPVGGVSDIYPRVFEPRLVALSKSRLAQLLGDRVPDAEVGRILQRLGFRPTPTADGWQVSVPPFRIDVWREADLIEEVGRHWGFDRIPATFPSLHAPPREMSPVIARDRLIRRVLCGAGLQEACTFTFIEKTAAESFTGTTGSGAGLVEILNPLSEKFAVLRPSLLPGLLDALVYSRRRETEDVRLFEAGAAFLPTGEAPRVGWVMTGKRSEHWSEAAGPVDFFDAKGIAELLAQAFDVSIVARATDSHPWFVRGRAADLYLGEDAPGIGASAIGSVGQLRPELAAARGLGSGGSVYGGELDPSALLHAAGARDTSIDPLPRHPSIVRDLSIFVGERLPAADLRGTIRSVAPPTLVSVREFDRYDGKGVPDGQISLSVRLTFRDRDRTLTDAEVQRAVDAIVAALATKHGAVLRSK